MSAILSLNDVTALPMGIAQRFLGRTIIRCGIRAGMDWAKTRWANTHAGDLVWVESDSAQHLQSDFYFYAYDLLSKAYDTITQPLSLVTQFARAMPLPSSHFHEMAEIVNAADLRIMLLNGSGVGVLNALLQALHTFSPVQLAALPSPPLRFPDIDVDLAIISGRTDVERSQLLSDRYPHECPRCGAPAYLGGNNNVDCSKRCV